ncbi:MAG: hypothetical protein HOF21_11695 [Nitrospina sp.]|nr:hypothetical protein [Nitrospina sp.]MBT5633084.1 hypothetical protein [Nitrospina sp.]MBT6248402.1 hypothetical protein [Nitrospina sp.]
MIHEKIYNTRQEAKAVIFEYIGVLQSATPALLSWLSQSGLLREIECGLTNCLVLRGKIIGV